LVVVVGVVIIRDPPHRRRRAIAIAEATVLPPAILTTRSTCPPSPLCTSPTSSLPPLHAQPTTDNNIHTRGQQKTYIPRYIPPSFPPHVYI
jgi:hypothetical protein